MTDIKILSLHTSYKTKIRCHILDCVTANIPINSLNKASIHIPDYVKADPKFNISQTIDLILGAGIFWDVIGNGRIKLSNNNLCLSETLFLWVIGETF